MYEVWVVASAFVDGAEAALEVGLFAVGPAVAAGVFEVGPAVAALASGPAVVVTLEAAEPAAAGCVVATWVPVVEVAEAPGFVAVAEESGLGRAS